MAKIDTSRMRPGTRVELDSGEPFIITEYQHVKPGKGGAFVRLKLKSLISGSVIDRTLRASESLEQAAVKHCQMQYLYADGSNRVFMDQKTFEQVEVRESLIENADLLMENCEVELVLHREEPIGVELPNFVVLEVTETDPPAKGRNLKPATLETGAVIQVPSFIERGNKLRIDTRDRSYASRA
ncbi:MAG: elongation factor P [Myxococcales bacterium]|nr:elongation factor P [Myxococcales bacterium]